MLNKCLISLLLVSLSLSSSSINALDSTILQVDPLASEVAIGDIFEVEITVTSVNSLYGWEFKLYYRNDVLNCTGVAEGSFLKSAGQTLFGGGFNNTSNSTHGRVQAFCTLLNPAPPVNGSGVLASITFKAKRRGSSTLDLCETKLSDNHIPPQSIPHSVVDGTVQVSGAVHDMAITNVTVWKTVISHGFSTNVTVTFENQGEFTETFNMTLYANTTMIERRLISDITNGTSDVAAFTWNTGSSDEGNYTITCVAEPVPDEVDTEDNTFVVTWIIVTIPGDVDGDGDVDILDVVKITAIYALKKGDPGFNPNSDIDNDGRITILDVVVCTGHYGEKRTALSGSGFEVGRKRL